MRLSALRPPSVGVGKTRSNPGANASRERNGVARMRKADHERDAAEQQFAADFLGIAHDAAALWRKCASKSCRRAQTCCGDVDECGARHFPEGWAWVRGVLQALPDTRRPGQAIRRANRDVIVLEEGGAFGPRSRTVVVHFPGLGESFEMAVQPGRTKARPRPSPLPRPLAPTQGLGHSRGRAKQAIPRRS